MSKDSQFSILSHKYYNENPVFLPENLLREARRQKNLPDCPVPDICLLDPDGDLVRYLQQKGKIEKNDCWACYHSEMFTTENDGRQIGIIPSIVGASYAVLVAEQLFVSGCKLLLSVTSAGILQEEKQEARFALITEAIRDEGTSYHYLPPDKSAVLQQSLKSPLRSAAEDGVFFEAKSWTTDAPYRETRQAIEAYRNQGATCVEMEAAALYAFAEQKEVAVICFAHLTNTMARKEGDFEKGEDFGSPATLNLISTVLRHLNKQELKLAQS